MWNELIENLKKAQKVNLVMVAANILVFLVLEMIGNTESSNFMLEHGAAYTPLIMGGEYYRMFTAMFLHFGITHLVFNMICLYTLGDMLERTIGHVKYLLLYLLGGLAGNALSLAVDLRTGSYAVSAGASGAIFAVMGAVFVIVLRNRNRFSRSYVQRMGMMVVLMVAEGFFVQGTDNAAHVGGVIAGCVLGFLLYRRKR